MQNCRSRWGFIDLHRIRALLIFFIAQLLAANVSLAGDAIVVYPVVREPFSKIYADMVSGLRESYEGQVTEYAINGDGVEHLRQRIENDPTVDVVFVLGEKGLRAISPLDIRVPKIAILSRTGEQEGLAASVILKPSAAAYIDKLLAINPGVKTINVVYKPGLHDTLLENARELLEPLNITLKAVPAENVREAAKGFRQLVNRAAHYDSVWLLADGGFLDASILSAVLDVAWDKRLIVFSSNPLFVDRGALFAIYPDNKALGARIGRLAGEVKAGKHSFGTVEYLNDVKLAYNERTGSHLGISLDAKTRNDVEMFLPDP